MSYIGKIPANAVLTTADLADGIVTAAKIEDGTVVAAEIASNAITTAKINADAITAAKIADNAINSEHYTDGSIDTAHIADVNVTQGKIADQAINEAKMQISNAPTNGYLLSAQSGNTGGLTWAAAPSGGLSNADFWRLNADVQFGTGVREIDEYWERADTDSFGVIGTGMSESSGIFSFPSTGIWLIQHQVSIFRSNGEIQRHDSRITMTTNNSSYDDAAFSHLSTDDANYRQSTCFSFIFDCENTSTHKIRFTYSDAGNNNPTLVGATNATCTGAMFVKLGDT